MNAKPSFFSELKRRNDLKVALVYAVVSWLLFELAWILLPTFDAREFRDSQSLPHAGHDIFVRLVCSCCMKVRPLSLDLQREANRENHGARYATSNCSGHTVQQSFIRTPGRT